MDLLIVVAPLVFLMFAAYYGHSVILFAPIAALGAVLLIDPQLVAPVFSGVFMAKMVNFIQLYFPVFVLGAIFGKLIELSGFAQSIASAVTRLLGPQHAIGAIVIVCALLTYGGVSLFVVVFTIYPFAAELFRRSGIPKRLIPGVIALGAFSFTMDALPGTPQIQNIIPTTFFKTDSWAAPYLGSIGGAFIIALSMFYLEWRRRQARAHSEGYGENSINEPTPFKQARLPHPLLAFLPLVVVGVSNKLFTDFIPRIYGKAYEVSLPGMTKPVKVDLDQLRGVWAVEGALFLGILIALLSSFRPIAKHFLTGSKVAVSGAMLAATNTAAEYGFGAVISTLPGFVMITEGLKSIANPLINEAVSVGTLAGITGSASGGLSIALAAMGNTFISMTQQAGIPIEVAHRVAAMASGSMDTLPHNGAVITLLTVTGLTHRQAYRDVFAITLIKTLAVFFVIGLFYATGIV